MKKLIGKILIGIGVLLLVLVLAVCLYVFIGKTVNRKGTAIQSDAGIRESVVIEVNGIQQELTICGEDQNNPVLLFIHGGPGSPFGFVNYLWRPYLDEAFTIVTYDQRGCGRTHYANPDAEVSKELILQDMDGIVDYLRERFDKEQVVIVGYSWGTLLGTTYVYEHPEKVSEYVGAGQVVNLYAGEDIAFNEAVKRATAADDTEYVTRITSAYTAFLSTRKIDEDFMTFRNMEPKYLRGDREKTVGQLLPAAITSPDMSMQDLKWYLIDSNQVLMAEDNPLTEALFCFDAYEMTDYQVPMYFISGGNDYVTPFPAVEAYYESITAPQKDMVIIDGVGHNAFLDVPEEFAAAIQQFVLGK